MSGKYKPTSSVSDPNDYNGMTKPSSMANFMGSNSNNNEHIERKLLRSQTLVESMSSKSKHHPPPSTSTITGASRFQQKNLIGMGDHMMNGGSSLMMKQRNSLVGSDIGDRVRTSHQRTESGSSAASSRRSSIDQHGGGGSSSNGFTVVGGAGRKHTTSGSSTNSSSSRPSETSTGKVLKNNFINTSKMYKNSRPNEKPMFY